MERRRDGRAADWSLTIKEITMFDIKTQDSAAGGHACHDVHLPATSGLERVYAAN